MNKEFKFYEDVLLRLAVGKDKLEIELCPAQSFIKILDVFT